MSLNQILNDIQDNVNNIPIATEGIVLTNQKESKFKVAPTNLDQKVLEKFNTLYNVITTRKNIYPLTKVDRKIAQEVFTMLPEVNPVEQAKITSYPSTINKDILDGVLNKIVETMPTEIITLFTELADQITSNTENIEKVVEGVTLYADVYDRESKRLSVNKPLIIYDKDSKDLFQSDLINCMYFKDTELDYEKYAGKLNKMFEELYYDPTLQTFYEHFIPKTEGQPSVTINSTSLASLCETLINLKNSVTADKSFLNHYSETLVKNLTNDSKTITDDSVYLVNNFNSIVSCLNTYKVLFDIFDQQDHFFEKLKRLLEFLD